MRYLGHLVSIPGTWCSLVVESTRPGWWVMLCFYFPLEFTVDGTEIPTPLLPLKEGSWRQVGIMEGDGGDEEEDDESGWIMFDEEDLEVKKGRMNVGASRRWNMNWEVLS